MNSSQFKYASQRLDAIAAEKIAAFSASLPKIPGLSDAEKIRMIRAGKARLRSDAKAYTDLRDAFDCEAPEVAASRKARETKIAEFKSRIMRDAQRIKDRLALVDGVSAAKEIESFVASFGFLGAKTKRRKI